MERLTKRCKQALNDEMTKFKKFIEIALSEMKYHEKGNFSTQSTYDIYETNRLYPMASKLADYEDAEEQGLLLRLPCKVGSELYVIRKLCDGKQTRVIENVIANSFDLRALQSFVITSNGHRLNFSNFGKTVFLTKEEAEKALADMGV